MDRQKRWRFEITLTTITLLTLSLSVDAWNENLYYNAIQMIANAAGAKDCWICTALLRGNMRLPLYRIGSTHWNCDNNTWPEFWKRQDGGYCSYDNSSYEIGPRFDLQILDNDTQILVSNNSCLWKARSNNCPCRPPANNKYHNCSCRNGWNDYWINKTVVEVGTWNLTGLNVTYINFCNRTQLETYSPTKWDASRNTSVGWVSKRSFYGANLTATDGPCKRPDGYWWLCGDGISRKQLPAGWKGMCTIGHLVSQGRIYNQSQIPRGILRTSWKQAKREDNPLVIRGTKFHSFVRWFLPWLGVSELEKAIVNISAVLEQMENLTINTIKNLQTEVSSLSKVVLQNRMALDLLTAKEGGVCMIINTSCCAYINKDKQIEADLNALWEKARIVQEVSSDDTSLGLRDLWDKLTSWLPNFGWLKQLFIGFITLAILGIFVCVFLKCFLWCHRNSAETYNDWKRNKIRHQVETGRYFTQTLEKDEIL
ncbi:endogenous retroviral envelope protein HEMO-like [Ciconia boyciana]|uniref:endogenous retroviral envelope protein HEMO-like n=1 Tax=Ciconia boyciana TaxID=52775 RepID=UPI003B9F4B8A